MGSKQETQFRNSERITLTTCPQKWWWSYVELLRSPERTPALRFGSLTHGALEKFYLPGIKRGPKPAETFEILFDAQQDVAYKLGMRDDEGTWHDMKELGVVLLEAYYEHYGADDRWYVVATEMPFRVRTHDPVSGVTFTFVGVVDGLWGDRASAKRGKKWGKLYIEDHKTTKDDPTKKSEALIMDEQSGSYWSYGQRYIRQQGILPKDQPLSGLMFNFLRKGKPDNRPQNKLGQYLNKPSKEVLTEAYARKFREPPNKKLTVADLMHLLGKSAEFLGEVSKVQPAPLFHREMSLRDEYECTSVMLRTEAQAALMHYMRSGKLRVTKTPGTLHNPHCNYCEFKPMCEAHEVGSDWEYMRDTMYSTWDPYAQHEVEVAEKV